MLNGQSCSILIEGPYRWCSGGSGGPRRGKSRRRRGGRGKRGFGRLAETGEEQEEEEAGFYRPRLHADRDITE